MYHQTKQTALSSVLFTAVLFILSLNSFAGDITVSVAKKSYNGADVSCYRAEDAQLTITAQGGSGIYTYSIDNGRNYQNSNVFSNLAGGQNYIVIVKDSKGLTSRAQWIWVSTIYNPVTISSSYATKTTCSTSSDGEISFSAFGGTGKLVFSIDNGATWQAETKFKNLAAGTYRLIARDYNGCTSDDKMITVEAGSGVKAVIDYREDYSCNWGKGKVQVRGTNGVAPYQYSIDGLPYVSSGEFSNLAPGSHTVVAVDSKGCTGSVSFTINAVLTATLSGDTTINEGGIAKLHVDINEGSARRTGYKLVLKGSNGELYTFNNLRSGENVLDMENISATTTFTISEVTSAAGCTAYSSGSANVTVAVEKRIVWLGINSNWNDKTNWSNNKVPGANTDILIGKKSNDPMINEDAYAQNITMGDGATLLLSGKLILSGNITGAAESVDALMGTIEFNGSEMQELNGNIFKGNNLGNMIISNNLNLSDSLNVYENIDFNATNKNFYTNDLLTLKSTAEGSANVGDLSRNKIQGKVTVENYIPAKKGWKFIAVSTRGSQTIKDAWQEGQSDNVNGFPGNGIQITGEMNDWKAKGFDAKSYTPSMKTYNSNTDLWEGIKSTYDSFKDTSNAYMVFIRGDRSATTVSAPANETTLRTKGELKSGDQSVINIEPGKFVPVGNPFASKLDLKKINADQKMFYYFWDPELGNNYGAYQTVKVKRDGSFRVIPGSKKISSDEVTVQSGQAFFVYAKKGGILQIKEDSKFVSKKDGQGDDNDDDDDDDGDRHQGRSALTAGVGSSDDELEIKLFAVVNGQTQLVDGVLQSFNSAYSKGFDEWDALKSANTGENLSIKADGRVLAIESSSFSENSDTTQLNLTGVKYQSYRFEISLNQQRFDKEAVLLDRFTGKTTPVLMGSVNNYEFAITRDAGSYAANRFLVIFRPLKPMPVTFNGVKAEKKESSVQVSWKVENEINVKQYNIEKSTYGVSFNTIGNVGADKSENYLFNDVNPANGINYYRVVSIDIDGKKGYSEIVKVAVNSTSNTTLNVYPNPVVGNTVKVQMNVHDKGIYYISIKNQIGQVVDTRKVNLSGSQNLEITPASKLPSGVYTIEVTYPTGAQSIARFVK